MSATSTQSSKTCLVNNWNYTEYIPVVPNYLIDNYVLIYYVRYDILSGLLVPTDFHRRNTESYQLGNVFRAICYRFAGPNCLASILKYIA